MQKCIKFHLLLFIVVFVVIGCSDESISSPEPTPPPTLPTVESMVMDFTVFEQEIDEESELSNEEFNNFSTAVSQVALIIPVSDWIYGLPSKLYVSAKDYEPSQIEQDKWEWTYSKFANDYTYEVRLTSTLISETMIEWECHITNAALNLNSFLLFSGTSNSQASQGEWTFVDVETPENLNPNAETTWSTQQDSKSMMLEVLPDAALFPDDTIEYSTEGSVMSVFFYNANVDRNTELQWNSETNEGYLVTPSFNDGKKVCWNSDYMNTACTD